MEFQEVLAEDTTNFPTLRKLVVDGVPYNFAHQIGRGSFSTVYAASDLFGNPLVVKIYKDNIKPEISRNEARLLTQFRSPYVPHLHKFFIHEGQAHLIMERTGVAIHRITFEASKARQKAVLDISSALLQVLHKMHFSGYYHGDINPQNVLVVVNSLQKCLRIKLIDFAFSAECKTQAINLNNIAQWTPPPEYFDDRIKPIGPAIDIYHLGVLLLQVLKGAKLAYTTNQILEDQPMKDAINLNTKIGGVLARCLAHQPSDRPSALELWKLISRVPQDDQSLVD
jgi:serine/threonine protein kinase